MDVEYVIESAIEFDEFSEEHNQAADKLDTAIAEFSAMLDPAQREKFVRDVEPLFCLESGLHVQDVARYICDNRDRFFS